MQKKFRITLEVTVGDLSDEARNAEASGMDIPLSELESLETTDPELIVREFMDYFYELGMLNESMFEGSDLMVQIDKVERLFPLQSITWEAESSPQRATARSRE
jgi:hypothetical protein